MSSSDSPHRPALFSTRARLALAAGAAFVVDAGIAKRKTASEYLQELERIGILAGETRGREVIYRHPALLEALAK
jgi:hypothetical protein